MNAALEQIKQEILAGADAQLFAKFEKFKSDLAGKIAKAKEELAQIKNFKYKV